MLYRVMGGSVRKVGGDKDEMGGGKWKVWFGDLTCCLCCSVHASL